MNQVITIPKRMAQRGDLVVIPRSEYEAMRRSLKGRTVKSAESDLDANIKKSLAEYRAGKYYGPFDTADEAVAFLTSRRKTKR
ncbi:MAG: hypothetical protein A3J10_01095 [Candidatus Sungbacteria bacterium RIFCSPLOWO2_02_FULL_54_10]|uniref:SpoVT-AbrB domain-containing protein n=1 Tax=Candidatus Sungbacteria bacterium RIFCSPLOWO2_01_FULL_54_21 TaxID=1802279 RepID=A0A1G2L978_9BACT|nr:MAG: hypothetical protein A2679_00590 [Candidatus Sungbacteria bacterium RIFCSPHIGHO2_01_FULL_54_26]OHA07372.1 MAG: hypothetical protein A3B34_02870 [Candidatus Sungbacteria bacterium RIFCSPLOWO2_01_FULL_54_21]OHA12712.1 MAG: hypothetical protein A3J10_01095 [Candidatus Sungbacteria bacterium RIFCSPLOWO2_02_FULL_54_10]